MGYTLPQSCADVVLCDPGKEPAPVVRTPRQPVLLGDDARIPSEIGPRIRGRRGWSGPCGMRTKFPRGCCLG